MKTKLLYTLMLFGLLTTVAFGQTWSTLGNATWSPANPKYISTAIDESTGELYVAIVKQTTNEELEVYKFNGNSWQVLTFGANAIVGTQTSIPSIRVNPVTGEPWVAYRVGSGNSAAVNVSRFDGTSWVSEGMNIGDPTELTPANEKIILHFDPSGNAYVAYKGIGGAFAYIRTNATGSWTTDRIISSAGVNGGDYDFDYPRFNKILRKGPRSTQDNARGRVVAHFISGSSWTSGLIYNDFNGRLSGDTDGFATDGVGSTYIAYSAFDGIQYYNGEIELPVIPNTVNIDPKSIQMFEGPFSSTKYVMYVENNGDVKVVSYDGTAWTELTGLNANIGTITGDEALLAKLNVRQSDGAVFATYRDGNSVTTKIYAVPQPEPQVFVDLNATGNNDGTSWADAFTNFQDGLNAAANSLNREVWVAQGTYKPAGANGNRNTAFVINDSDIKVYGGFDGTETTLAERDFRNNPTILSGDLNGNDTYAGIVAWEYPFWDDNSYNVVRLGANANNTMIDGFTIRGGHADNVSNGASQNQNRGAAIQKDFDAVDFTLRNSIIEFNVSDREGNVNLLHDGTTSTIIIENNIFRSNWSRYGSGFEVAGISNANVTLEANGNLFHSNIAGNRPNSSVSGFAGSSVAIFGNSATVNASFVNNTFTNNQDNGSGSGNNPGTIVMRRLNNAGTNPIVNGTFHNNIFWDNTIQGQPATRDIGLFNQPTLLNSITYTYNITQNESALNSITPSLVTNNNQNVDPLFVQGAFGTPFDFRLQSSSPAIDAGDGALVPTTLTNDLDGLSRSLGANVDIGAYEFNNDTTAPTVVTQDITVQLDATGNVTIQPSDVDNGSSDNSSGSLNLSLDVSSFDCTNIGANTVTLTVTDQAGNSASDTAIVTVVDSTAPNVVAQDVTLALGPNGTVNVTAQDVDNGSTDNCGVDLILSQFSQDLFTCADLGTNTVQYLLRDSSSNVGQATVVITIVDQTAAVPDVANLADITAQCEVTSLTAPTATDNCAGAITATSNVTLPLTASTAITWTYDDGNGNTSTQTQNVVIADTTAPTLSTQNTTVDLAGNASVSITELDVVVNSSDNCSGTVAISLSQSIFTAVGTYNVDVTATDIAGNSITQTVVVTVDDTLSIDHANKLQVKFYPNPVQTVLNIEVPDFKEARLYDLSGRIISKSNSPQIPMGDLSSGIYIIQVKDHQNRTASKRVVKK